MLENLNYMLDNEVQCPPGMFGFMRIEKMYFQQPVIFPASTDFTSAFTFDGVSYISNQFSIGYDGSGNFQVFVIFELEST